MMYRFPPTAATVSSSLLLGICSLPDTAFKVRRLYRFDSSRDVLYLNVTRTIQNLMPIT